MITLLIESLYQTLHVHPEIENIFNTTSILNPIRIFTVADKRNKGEEE